MSVIHEPVLSEEVIRGLAPQANQDFVDATVGEGGHAELLLERIGPKGRLLAFDRDAKNLAAAQERLQRFGERVIFIHDSYRKVTSYAYVYGFVSCAGVLMDLGFCSGQVEDASRGFSFQRSGPLDMRYDQRQELTAEMVVNSWSADDLASIFVDFGEERRAWPIAKRIVAERRRERIRTTDRLAEIVAGAVPHRFSRLHPATHVFQALRIAVNDELGELTNALPEMIKLLASGGRIAIISFHSLEDRIVKRFFKERSEQDLRLITKRPIIASPAELAVNRRSRSAKLRIAEII